MKLYYTNIGLMGAAREGRGKGSALEVGQRGQDEEKEENGEKVEKAVLLNLRAFYLIVVIKLQYDNC